MSDFMELSITVSDDILRFEDPVHEAVRRVFRKAEIAVTDNEITVKDDGLLAHFTPPEKVRVFRQARRLGLGPQGFTFVLPVFLAPVSD